MKLALALAEKGLGTTSPNPMVGAVVVKDGEVIGEGYHQKAGSPHAEIHALKDAGEHARDATLYVSLEPCNHAGRTPPCTEAIVKSGITTVVAGMKDPNPTVAGGGLAYLANHGIDIIAGVLEPACQRLNEAFVKYITTSLPFVMLKCAATLDGRIATSTGDSKWITNARSRAFVHRLRHATDGIMVGRGTVRADNPSLTTRLERGEGRDAVRIILDTHLSISSDAKILHLSSHSDTLIVTARTVAPDKKKAIEKLGAHLLPVDTCDGRIDLPSLLRKLGERGITSLLIEGGSGVNGSALRAGIVDKVYMFYAPKIYGGDDGVPVCAGAGVERMEACLRLKNISIHRFEDDVMIEGYVVK